MKDIDEIFPIIIKNHKFIINYDKLQIKCSNCDIVYVDFSKYNDIDLFKDMTAIGFNSDVKINNMIKLKELAYKINCNEQIIKNIIE